MEKFRLVQIGTRHDHAWCLYNSIVNVIPEKVDLLGIIEDNPEYQEDLRDNWGFKGKFLSFEEALELKPDGFIIETAEHALVPWAQKVIRAGYPVHMDKPGSENSSEFHRLCDMAKEKGLVLTLGYMYRNNPAVQHALKLKEEGELGEIFSVEAQMNILHEREKRAWMSCFKGGMMYFLGCHLIDLVVLFCGFPESVIPLNCSTGIDGVTANDFGFCVLKYKNGVSFVKTCDAEINGFDRRQLVVTGSKGSIEIRPIEAILPGGAMNVFAKETLGVQPPQYTAVDRSVPLTYPTYERYAPMVENFISYVRGEAKNPYSYEYEAKLHDLILECCGISKEDYEVGKK